MGHTVTKQEGRIEVELALNELELVPPIRVADVHLFIGRCKIATRHPDSLGCIFVRKIEDWLKTIILGVELTFRAVVINRQLIEVGMPHTRLGHRGFFLCLPRCERQIRDEAGLAILLEDDVIA